MGMEGGGSALFSQATKMVAGLWKDLNPRWFLAFLPVLGIFGSRRPSGAFRGERLSLSAGLGGTRRSGGQEAPGLSFSEERVHTDVYDVL